MTLAFFSDIHANLPALEAVLNDMDRHAPDMRFSLGDIVGYAPCPTRSSRSFANTASRRLRAIALPGAFAAMLRQAY